MNRLTQLIGASARLVVLPNPEAHRSLRRCRRSDQLTEGAEDLLQLPIVLAHTLFDLLQPLLDRRIGVGDPAQLDNARMISMFTAMAVLLRSTEESIATPAQ